MAFNAFQTSVRQKVELNVTDPDKADAWDVTKARQRGYRLFADALATDDPLRAGLSVSTDARMGQIRAALDALALDQLDFPDDSVRALCDQIKIRANETPEANIILCNRDLLVSTARSILPLSRILGPHLRTRLKRYPDLRLFIYGHTHQADYDITVKAEESRSVDVFNTGAFQRLLDEEHFRQRAEARRISPEAALRELTLEQDFPACYSTVIVTHDPEGVASAKVEQWLMSETDSGGQFVGACDGRCGALPPRCKAK